LCTIFVGEVENHLRLNQRQRTGPTTKQKRYQTRGTEYRQQDPTVQLPVVKVWSEKTVRKVAKRVFKRREKKTLKSGLG